jgi:hypothetical protein
MIPIQNSINIGSGIQKLMGGGGYTDTHRLITGSGMDGWIY